MAAVPHGRTLKRADPSSIQDKFLVGYQGWFTCAGDGIPVGPGHHGWLHWFTYPIPDGGRPNTDLWPDTSEYSPSELYAAPGLKYAYGEQAFLFSSRHPKTVRRHFHWMALHGVDGAFLQRFVGQCDLEEGNHGIRSIRDEVGDRVREAAEAEGRVFAIMYDVAGVGADRVQQIIEQDWLHLVHEKGVLDSPNYLKEKGRPVICIWGLGFSDRGDNPDMVRAITSFIRNNTPGGAYIMAGTAAYWRTSRNDADSNPEFVDLWLDEFDAISPWTVGRYTTLEDIDNFTEETIKGDAQLIKKRNEDFELGKGGQRKVDYIPVVLPGSSGFNLSEGNWSWNGIPRQGGRFLWRQIVNVRRQNVRTIYGAMWDEYDEGTAYMPVVSHKRQVPVHEKYNFMALDEDGFDLPPDWYMRICGFAAENLRGERLIHETFPSKELQDYWSTRPRYEDKGRSDEAASSASGSGEGKKNEGWEEWEKAEKAKETQDEPPPPPYTFEAEEPTPTSGPSVQPVIVEHSSSISATSVSVSQPPVVPRPSLPPAATKPTLPASSRPDSSVHTAFPVPPPIVVGSRPTLPIAHTTSPQAIQQSFSDSAAHVSVLADDFARQTLSSSPSPRLEPPPLHPAHPEAKKRPVSPRPHISPSHSPPFPSSPAFPVPGGFAPQIAAEVSGQGRSSFPGSAPGSAWPPPDWGVNPSHAHAPSPPFHNRPSLHQYPDSQSNSGYRPGYTPGYPSPPHASAPPLPQAHSSGYPPGVPYPPPPQLSTPPVPSSPYGSGPGFGFPQEAPQAGAPYPPYGSSGPPAAGYPGAAGSGYPPYGSGPPGSNPYGPAMSPYPPNGPPPPAGPRPPAQYSTYPGNASKPPQGSNYFNSALNAIGSATGQSGKLQSLTQSGGKLWDKFRK